MSGDATRRSLIKRGLVVVTARGDVAVLGDLIALEQLLVLGYERELSSGALGPSPRGVIEVFLGHERAHSAALTAELQRLGGAAPAAPSTATVPDPGSRDQALRALLALEHDALGSYYRALGKLRDGRAALVAAQIMANEAQHATGLMELLIPGHPKLAVPSPFAYGT
jgi:hypothetical protein